MRVLRFSSRSDTPSNNAQKLSLTMFNLVLVKLKDRAGAVWSVFRGYPNFLLGAHLNPPKDKTKLNS